MRTAILLATAAFGLAFAPAARAAPPQEGAPAQTPAPTAADEALRTLYEGDRAWQMKRSGTIEGPDGSLEAGPRLPDAAPAAQEEAARHAQAMLDALATIDRDRLSPTERINAAVFATLQRETLGDARFREWEMPFNSDSNFWTYLDEPAPLTSVARYENYIARMRDVPRYFAQNIANARTGLARGFSVPRVSIKGREKSVEPYLDAGDDNPFWQAFAAMPASIPAQERARLQAAGRAAIREAIVPAYGTLATFLADEYIPATRTSLAAADLPDGRAYYAQQIQQYTTLDLTADEIHRIGLDEVARIEGEMRAIMAEVGFSGTIAQFNESLRTDPRFIAGSPDELMGVSAYVAKRVDGRLADYFGFLPRHRFTIRPVAPALAPFYTAGRGGLDACQMNTYDLPSRPLYNIPVLTLHECIPGHSFQAGVALELPALPDFRRQTYFSGFGEGWGLYTEFLGEEMGIYRTPYERFGRLSYEMWRAARLVIDTGIHADEWSRARAIDYLADRTALSRHEVETEIDRYISWPGQALAYKLGELTILRVRKKAEQALGPRFDIRKFHDVVLSLGSVPLPVLEERIDRFIAEGGPGLDGVTYD